MAFIGDYPTFWQRLAEFMTRRHSNLQQNALEVAVISTVGGYVQSTLDLNYTMPFSYWNTQHKCCDVPEASGN